MAEHVRIDEGIARGPRKKHPPKAARTGMFICQVSPERKQEIIKGALTGIAQGQNSEAIGATYGVPGRTIRYWLLNDDKAEQARKCLVDQELARCGEEIRDAQEPLPLARAREEFRYWSWIAERRDSARYGQKQELTVKAEFSIDTILDGHCSRLLDKLAAHAQPRLINQLEDDAVQQSDQSIETPSQVIDNPK